MAADPATRTRLGDPQAWGWMDVSKALDRMATILFWRQADGTKILAHASRSRAGDRASSWRRFLGLARPILEHPCTRRTGGGRSEGGVGHG